MKILCNKLGGLEPGAWAIEGDHEIIRLGPEGCLEAWYCGSERWWEELLPDGWVPDVALFYGLEYAVAPPHIWDLPCPVAVWSGDWYADPHGLRRLSPHVDLILADKAGTELLRGVGVDNAEEACPWVFDPAMHQRGWGEPMEYDLSFIGNFNHAIHLRRARWLDRLTRLPERYRVWAGTVYGEGYGDKLRRSRIGFNHTVGFGANMRCFEVPACGSMLMVERENREIADWFKPGEEVVLYGEDDFEDVVAYYLENEEERQAIADAGWHRVREHGAELRLPRVIERLEALASSPPRRSRPAAGQALSINAHLALHCSAGLRPSASLEQRLEDAEQAGRLTPDLMVSRADLYRTIGLVNMPHRRDEMLEAAVHYAEQAVAADPDDAVARFNLAVLHQERGDAEPYARVLRELLDALDAGTARVHPDRLRARGGVDELWMAWSDACFQPDPVPELTRILAAEVAGRLARVTPDLHDRVELARRGVEANPGAVHPRRRLAATLALAGRSEEALEEIRAALRVSPMLEPLWTEHAEILVFMGRVEDAEAVLADAQRIAKRVPRFEDVVTNLRNVLPDAPTVCPSELDAA